MFNQQMHSQFHSMHSLVPQQLQQQVQQPNQQMVNDFWLRSSKQDLLANNHNFNNNHAANNLYYQNPTNGSSRHGLANVPLVCETDTNQLLNNHHQHHQQQQQHQLQQQHQQQQRHNWLVNNNGITNGNGNGNNNHNHYRNNANFNSAQPNVLSFSPMSVAGDCLPSLQKTITQPRPQSHPTSPKSTPMSSEFDLMREVVFALQGLPGKIIRPDHNGRFIISHDHLSSIDPTQRILLEKLTGFGWLVNKIKSYINTVNKEKNQGKVSQGLASALKEELLDYYSMVTMIDQQLSSNNSPVPVTLHQIHVWSLDYYFKFKTLAMLVDACQDRHGGQIACIVYRFKQQGDKQIKEMISRVSTHVMAPIRQMLNKWIFHGEIHDQYQEFFICQQFKQSMSAITHHHHSITNSQSEYQLDSILYKQHQQQQQQQQQQLQPLKLQLQHHQKQPFTSLNSIDEIEYVINPKMMPGFITKQQANKILVTGKAVHLLRKVCGASLPIYEHLQKAFESTICVEDIAFENLLEKAHKEFSQKALEMLLENFKLKKHLKAMRQYLLLGQGDFIRHLIDLLEPELEKPKNECRFNNINSILLNAIKSTNAQYEDTDITNRLDCRLLDVEAKNACGWDTFTLLYKVDEPINSIFTEEKMRDYTEIFKQLWRAKRIEHILASLWSAQMYYSKKAKANPIVSQLFHKANLLLEKMVHFMQQFQDFVMFQVVEYCWNELEAATECARDVDDMISAHNLYLKKIKLGSLCQKDNKSEALNAQVNGLFQCALELKDLLTSLWIEIDSGIDKKLIVKEKLKETQLNKLSAELTSKQHLMSSITNYWVQNSQIKVQY